MINRKIWSFEFSEGATDTPWPCPSCGQGHLRIAENSLSWAQLASTRIVVGEIWWEPEMEKGRFSATAYCVREDCKEPVALLGSTRTVQVPDDDYTQEQYVRYYQVLLMDPPPRLIEIPQGVPNAVTELVQATCRYVWIDPSSSGNRGRAAVEQLLNELRIPRRRRTKSGKYKSLQLWERISLFGERRRADLAEKLTAIRWVGNAGSHSSSMTTEVVLDGLDILWYVLDELYVGRKRHVARLAKRLTQRKGRP